MPCAAPSRNNLGVLGPCGYKKLLSVGGFTDPLAYSPKGLWRLNEPSGTSAADASGNGNNGVISGGVLLNQQAAPLAPAGTSMSFDGTGAITVASNPALNLGDVFTLEAWIATTSLAEQDIFYKSGAYELEVANVGGLKLRFVKAGVQYLAVAGAGNSLPNDGLFHHVAAVKNGSDIRLYQDGVDITPGATITPGTCVDTANPLVIGQRAGGTMGMVGRIDEPAIYNVALTTQQIQTRMGGKDVSADSLCMFHYAMKYGQSAVRQPMAVEP